MVANTRKLKAYAYLRVSTEAQGGEDKVSLEEQAHEIEALAEREGAEVVRKFSDIGSGADKNRPSFQRMLSEVEANEVDLVLCWKGDRLARGVSPAAALLDALEGTDIEIKAVVDHIDRQFFVLMAWFGGMELDNLRERVSMGKRGRARAGMIPSKSIGYGYTVDEAGFAVIDKKNAAIVKYIYNLTIDENLGTSAIAKRLNMENISPPANGKKGWSQGMVLVMLRDPTYKGARPYGRKRHSRTSKGLRITIQPEENWIIISVPAIIDEKRWQIAQEMIDKRKAYSPRNTKAFYLVQGLLYCTECSRKFSARANMGRTVKKNGKTYRYPLDTPHRYYECNGIIYDKTDCRQPKTIKAERIESLIWDVLAGMINDPAIVLSGIESQNLNAQRVSELDRHIEEADSALEEAKRTIQGLIHLCASGRITEQELDSELPPFRERETHYGDKLHDLTEQRTLSALEENQKKDIQRWAESFQQALEMLTDDQRRELVRDVFTRIDMNGKNELTLTVGLPGKELVAIDTDGSSP